LSVHLATFLAMTEPTYLGATRVAYDTVAVDYAALLRTELAAKPLDRAMLAAFAELVRADGAGPVADLGCGPGRVTAHLRDLGLTAFGVDLSPAMVAVARETYPDLRFDEGAMTDLDLADGALGGIVAWYSIIHTPPERLPVVFAEFHRVLAPGGHLLLAFQAGDECLRLEQAYGHEISLDAYRLSPDRIAEMLSRAGLAGHARLIREPEGREKTPQAYLMARKRTRP
jgi:SAM-dependent methyltransferase